jgi:NAD(P)-dependent dehydrogenase (short-subunit alcohol dehydrogenase family)
MRNKVLLVTGGSGEIGAATAIKAARQQYKICMSYLSHKDRADAVLSKIQDIGGQALAVQADTSKADDVSALFARCQKELGPVTHLVNNAGIVGHMSKVVDLPLTVLKRVLEVNVIGYFLCAREAIRSMSIERGGSGGVIVNVSSRASALGGPNEWVHYAASKGAIDTMTIGLAKEVAAEGIRVNAVNPGLIDTSFHASAGDPGRLARLTHTVPMGRAGSVDEVAEAIMFLLSDNASYITGVCLDVSGGR